jgi:hypothetical protein
MNIEVFVSSFPVAAKLKLVYFMTCSSVHYHNLIFLVKYNILNLEKYITDSHRLTPVRSIKIISNHYFALVNNSE